MNIIVSKPTIDGFFSAVYSYYYDQTDAEKITSNAASLTLIDNFSVIEENKQKAQKVRDGIIKKGGLKALDEVLDAYRSGNPNKEQIIFEYLKVFFKFGRATEEMYANPAVIDFNDIVRKVWHECHRLEAFIRLQEMKSGIYYAYYSSDNDILEKLVPAIKGRFNSMHFILHDYKRRKMAFCTPDGVFYDEAPEFLEIELSESEIFFQKIWQNYHKNVSIKERENQRLQRAFLPKKYRHFMCEFDTQAK